MARQIVAARAGVGVWGGDAVEIIWGLEPSPRFAGAGSFRAPSPIQSIERSHHEGQASIYKIIDFYLASVNISLVGVHCDSASITDYRRPRRRRAALAATAKKKSQGDRNPAQQKIYLLLL